MTTSTTTPDGVAATLGAPRAATPVRRRRGPVPRWWRDVTAASGWLVVLGVTALWVAGGGAQELGCRAGGSPSTRRASSRGGPSPVPGHTSTSGAARRGTQVVDPATGEGISRQGSCTVVGPDLLWAEVWATAAWVDAVRATR